MQGFTTKYYLCEAERGDCSEPSGYNLAYNKDMANTFATQFPSGRPKLICEHVGVCSVRMCVKGSYEVKEYRSEKRKEARAYLLFWLYGYNGKITKSNMKIQFGLVC